MLKMRAIDIEGGKGSASSLFMSFDILKPVPAQGQALVKIRCFGINRMDLAQRSGNYPVPDNASPILGVEFSGTIDQIGDQKLEHEGFHVGDEVFGLTYGGAYAEYVAVSTRTLIHKPKEISWELAAGIPEVWMTATQAMSLVGGFSPGKSILWHAGASTVSIAGIQLSKILGASAVYATAGTQDKLDHCKSIGATEAWNYREVDWAQELDKVTHGKGVDIIIDFVGQGYFQQNLNSTSLDGRIVIVGLLSGNKTAEGIDLTPFAKRRLRVEGSRLRSRDTSYQGILRDMVVENILPKLVDGSLKSPIERVFDWHSIKDAHELMESNQTMGKIICKVA